MNRTVRPFAKGLVQMSTLGWGRVPAAIALFALTVAAARAQTLPWPGEGRPGGQAPNAAPSGPPPMMGVPQGGGFSDGPPPGAPSQAQQACLNEFMQLRGETEKRGALLKSASERRAPREEVCKLLVGVHTADSKWLKFTETNMARCQIPAQALKQLRASHAHLSNLRKRACDSGGAAGGAPAPPSLSEALSNTRGPPPDSSSVKRGGTFDTLTGNPIR